MYERILVGTDGSATAARAVDRAAELAGATGASLTVLSAGDERATRAVVDAELARLDGRVAELRGRTPARDPAVAIVEEATGGGYDLVVVGNVGMTGPRSAHLLGSVPNKVSHAVPCSLLIVRTDT